MAHLQAENAERVRERDVARLQLQNQQRALALFNQLSKASIDEKNANQRHIEEERRQVRSGPWMRPVCLCLPLWLTGCAVPSTQYVPIAPPPIPAEWLQDCRVPPLPAPFTFGASVEYNLQLLGVIKNCNVDKANIRQAEQDRQGTSGSNPFLQ